MSGSQSSDVVQGLYVDYGRSLMNRYQWLQSTGHSVIWTNFLGILVTIACARILKILWRMDVHAANLVAQRFPLPGGASNPHHILFNLDNDDEEPTLEGLAWYMFFNLWSRIRPGAVALPGAARPNLRGRNVAFFLMGAVALASTYIGVLAFGVMTAWLATDTIALSASPGCGLYVPVPDADQYTVTRPYEFDTQLASATLAKDCYSADPGADGCNFFFQQSIPYETEHNASCPFPDYMCHFGTSGAVKFYTPPISARALGVNGPKMYDFQKNTTCSPLNMNETFIQLHRDGEEYTFSYHYGPAIGIGDWTWRTDGYRTNLGKPPSYLVGTLGAWPESSVPRPWNPIQELDPPSGAYTTIIFILPQKIYYLNPSTDPIFPANREVHLPDDHTNTSFWLYTRGHATVLACSDQTSWRNPEAGPAWNTISANPPSADLNDSRAKGGIWLFWFSIRNSIIFQSISQRLGNALNASERLSGFTSLPLSPEQWKVEAKRLFETSLARTQIDARNIARGVTAEYPGYVRANQTPPEMCQGTYLFVSQGWTNVNFVVSMLIVIPSVICVILAFPTFTEDEIVLEWLLCGFVTPVSYITIKTIIGLGDFTGWIFATFLPKVFVGLLNGIKQGSVKGWSAGRKFWRWITDS